MQIDLSDNKDANVQGPIVSISICRENKTVCKEIELGPASSFPEHCCLRKRSDDGNVIKVKPEQPANADSSIVRTEDGSAKWTHLRDGQPTCVNCVIAFEFVLDNRLSPKHDWEIKRNELGTQIECNILHPAKAYGSSRAITEPNSNVTVCKC
jgi:hypothetical protein